MIRRWIVLATLGGGSTCAILISCFSDPREDDQVVVTDTCDLQQLNAEPTSPKSAMLVYMNASQALLDQSKLADTALADVCNAIDTDLGLPTGQGSPAACRPLIARVSDVNKKAPPAAGLTATGWVEMHFPKTCVSAPGSREACLAKCSGPCDTTKCDPAALVGKCNGECTGQCVNEGTNIPCNGKCVGELNVDGGTCLGECNGVCNSVAWVGDCTGACPAKFTGDCGGTCTGTCNGVPVGDVASPDAGSDAGSDAEAGAALEAGAGDGGGPPAEAGPPPSPFPQPPGGADGNCVGICKGVCSSGANGDCSGPCRTYKAGPPLGQYSDGFCGSSGVPGACIGACTSATGTGTTTVCTGTCTQANVKQCTGTCRGGCTGTLENPSCEGIASCNQNPICNNACTAAAALAEACSEPTFAQLYSVSDPVLYTALMKHEGALGKVHNQLEQLRIAEESIATVALGDFSSLGLTGDLARACVTQGRSNVDAARASIEATINADPTGGSSTMPRVTKTRSSLLVVFLLLGCCATIGPSSSGCAAINNTTAVQCSSEAECLSLGPEFVGSTCDKTTRTCIKQDDSVGLCKTNQECLDRFSGAPATCRKSDKRCIPLTSVECPHLLTKAGNAELADDNTIFIGALTPSGTVEAGNIVEATIGLAQSEISSNFTRGLPPAPNSTASRPLVVVSCQETTVAGVDGLLRAAHHLADVVEVPLVIGPYDSANIVVTAGQVFNPKRILTIAPTSTISSLNQLPNPLSPTPLIWRMQFDDKALGNATGAFITSQLEPHLKTLAVDPIKIAMVVEDNFAGHALANAAREKLNFNGKSAAENSADGNYLELVYGDLLDPVANPNPDASVGALLAQIAQYKPSIIIDSFAVYGVLKIVPGIEGIWPAGQRRPYQITLNPAVSGIPPLVTFIDTFPTAQSRFFGVHPYTYPVAACDEATDPKCQPPFPITSAPVQAWIQRFNSHFSQFASSPSAQFTLGNSLVWAGYDAGILAAYAIIALRDKPITGANLAAVLGQFAKGNPKRVRTYEAADQSIAFEELGAGRGIDIEGLSGTMDYDLAAGAPVYSVEMTCPTVNPATKKTITLGGSGFHTTASGQIVVSSADGSTDGAATTPLTVCPPPLQ